MARPSKHTIPPSEMILRTLRKSKAPMSAYEILGSIRAFGVKSPPIVYRALSSLQKTGDIHRIEQLNAYVACDCTNNHTHALSVLAVCTTCQSVNELHDHAIIHHLEALRKKGLNIPDGAVMEIPVTCNDCLN